MVVSGCALQGCIFLLAQGPWQGEKMEYDDYAYQSVLQKAFDEEYNKLTGTTACLDTAYVGTDGDDQPDVELLPSSINPTASPGAGAKLHTPGNGEGYVTSERVSSQIDQLILVALPSGYVSEEETSFSQEEFDHAYCDAVHYLGAQNLRDHTSSRLSCKLINIPDSIKLKNNDSSRSLSSETPDECVVINSERACVHTGLRVAVSNKDETNGIQTGGGIVGESETNKQLTNHLCHPRRSTRPLQPRIDHGPQFNWSTSRQSKNTHYKSKQKLAQFPPQRKVSDNIAPVPRIKWDKLKRTSKKERKSNKVKAQNIPGASFKTVKVFRLAPVPKCKRTGTLSYKNKKIDSQKPREKLDGSQKDPSLSAKKGLKRLSVLNKLEEKQDGQDDSPGELSRVGLFSDKTSARRIVGLNERLRARDSCCHAGNVWKQIHSG